MDANCGRVDRTSMFQRRLPLKILLGGFECFRSLGRLGESPSYELWSRLTFLSHPLYLYRHRVPKQWFQTTEKRFLFLSQGHRQKSISGARVTTKKCLQKWRNIWGNSLTETKKKSSSVLNWHRRLFADNYERSLWTPKVIKTSLLNNKALSSSTTKRHLNS